MESRKMWLFRVGYLFLQGLLFAPWIIMPISSGLDPSWVYGVNIYQVEHVVFGRDILFTYGPLGYIFFAQPMGNNLQVSFLLLTATFLVMAGMTAFVLFSRSFANLQKRAGNLALSLFFLYAAFLVGDYLPEYWTTYMLLFALSGILVRERDRGYGFFCLAVVITVFSTFLKFNTGVLNLICMYAFLFVLLLRRDARLKVMGAVTVLGIPLLFSAGYLYYNFNFHDLGMYVYAALNISSGYTYNMSMDIRDRFYVKYIAAIVILGLGCLWRLVRSERRNGLYFILFLGAAFVTIKHGIVRGDHIRIIPSVFALYCSIYVLFMKSDVKDFLQGWRKYAACLLCLLFVIFPMRHMDKSNVLQPLESGWAHVQTVRRISSVTFQEADLRKDVLDPAFSREIGRHSMTVYPWDIALYNSGEHVFRSIPVFPINSGTTFLDGKNGEFFAAEDAPEYVVLNLNTVDNQYPLINCPALWTQVSRHYDVLDYDGLNFLLKRRQVMPEVAEHELESRMVGREDTITIPVDAPQVMLKLEADLSIKGKLAKIFYKIPEVNMDVVLSDGTVMHHRILLDVLRNPVRIDAIPSEPADFVKIMDDAPDIRKVREIRFSGNGLKYYKDRMKITFLGVDFDKFSMQQAEPKAERMRKMFSAISLR